MIKHMRHKAWVSCAFFMFGFSAKFFGKGVNGENTLFCYYSG